MSTIATSLIDVTLTSGQVFSAMSITTPEEDEDSAKFFFETSNPDRPDIDGAIKVTQWEIKKADQSVGQMTRWSVPYACVVSY